MESLPKLICFVVAITLLSAWGQSRADGQDHPAVQAAREKFEKQAEAAVAPVRSRYQEELKSLKSNLERQRDGKGAEAVDAELQRIEETERLYERHFLQGFWEVSYSNGTVRTYHITNTGLVNFIEEKRTGRIVRNGKDHVVSFGDGKVERLTFHPTILVEHFHPQTTYPLGAPKATGTAVRTRR